MYVDKEQIRKSGIIKDFEDIIFAVPATHIDRTKGVIVLTNVAFYFIIKPSIFSKGYIEDFMFGLNHLVSVSTKGLISKNLVVQSSSYVNVFRCNEAEFLAEKILHAKKRNDKEKIEYDIKKEREKVGRHCPECGRKIPFDAHICPYCGIKFEKNFEYDNKTYNYNKKTYIDKDGYLRFKDTEILVHRWVMEKYTGRKLKPWEVIHHIDGNKLNNNTENLRILTGPYSRETHTNIHQKQKKETGNWHGKK